MHRKAIIVIIGRLLQIIRVDVVDLVASLRLNGVLYLVLVTLVLFLVDYVPVLFQGDHVFHDQVVYWVGRGTRFSRSGLALSRD